MVVRWNVALRIAALVTVLLLLAFAGSDSLGAFGPNGLTCCP